MIVKLVKANVIAGKRFDESPDRKKCRLKMIHPPDNLHALLNPIFIPRWQTPLANNAHR